MVIKYSSLVIPIKAIVCFNKIRIVSFFLREQANPFYLLRSCTNHHHSAELRPDSIRPQPYPASAAETGGTQQLSAWLDGTRPRAHVSFPRIRSSNKGIHFGFPPPFPPMKPPLLGHSHRASRGWGICALIWRDFFVCFYCRVGLWVFHVPCHTGCNLKKHETFTVSDAGSRKAVFNPLQAGLTFLIELRI